MPRIQRREVSSLARRVATVVAVVASLAVGAAPAVAAAHSVVPASVRAGLAGAAPGDDVAADIVKAINDERAKAVGPDDQPRPMKPLQVLDCTTQQAAVRVPTMDPGQRGSSGLGDVVRPTCHLDSQLVGNVGPAGASGADIVAGWMKDTGDRQKLLGAYTNVGVACSNKYTKPGEWLCEAIFSNPAHPDPLTVTIFGDSYTSGNGVGDGAEDWRGQTATKSFQSPRSQGNVMANLLRGWTGKAVTVDDYSHSGAVTASKASKPLVFADGAPANLVDLEAADTAAREDGLSSTKTLEQQVDLALAEHPDRIPQGVILVGIGGNDIAFGEIARSLLVFPYSETAARQALTNAQGLLEPAMVRAQEQITRLIRNAAPNSVVLVQGYPYLANAEGSPTIYGCKLDGQFVDAQVYCSGDGVLGDRGTKTEYQPASQLRSFQDAAESRFQKMVDDLGDTATAYGVEVRFVPYAAATDGQAAYMANGKASPTRGITAAFEVGDEHSFCIPPFCSAMQYIHPAARLRAQEGNLLFASLVRAPVSHARSTFFDQPLSDVADRNAPRLTAGALPAGRVGTPYAFFLTADGAPAPKYTVNGGRLPDGMTLYQSGVLGGTPTQPGDYTFTVKATNAVDGSDRSDSADYAIHVDASGPSSLPLFLGGPDLAVPAATVGSLFTYTPEVSGSPAPTFSVVGSLPPGLHFYPGTGTVSGTPALPGDYTVTVVASNVIDGQVQTTSTELVFHVDLANTPPVITSDTAPAGTVGAEYAFTVRTTGSPAPTFEVTDGALPPGLALDPATGTVSGTPTTAGEYPVTVTASNTFDGQTHTDSARYTVEIAMPVLEAPVITLGTVPTATVGIPYAFTVEATGNPAPTFAVTDGALPPGLEFDAVTGAITGTPTQDGAYTFTVTASSTIGGQVRTDSAELTVQVDLPDAEPAPPVISAGNVPVGTVGLPYAFAFEATGNPAPTFEVTEGTLPPGLNLDPVTGTVSGTPALPGDRTVTVTASNTIDGQTRSDSVQVTFHVDLAEAAPTITSGAAPAGTVGEEYAFTVTATGNPAPRFEVTDGALPDGLVLDPATGTVSGTPTADGEYVVTVTASNTVAGETRTDAVRLTIVVDPAGLPDAPPVVTTDAAPAATVGVAYAFTVQATGRPAPTFEVTDGALPDGLVLDPVTGTVSGTPSVAGEYPVTVAASNAAGSDSVRLTVVVAPAGPLEVPPTIVAGTAPAGTVDVAYTFTVQATGNPAPTFAVTAGDLPAGLALDPVTGTIAGTPTAAGDVTVTVTASNTVDGQVRSDSARFTLHVEGPSDNPTPTDSPTSSPTDSPTDTPTSSPTSSPTGSPTDTPTASPTSSPTDSPTSSPTASPTDTPTSSPTDTPTSGPTLSSGPTSTPSAAPGGTTTRLPLTGAGGTVVIVVVAGMALLSGLAAVAARRRRAS